MPNLNQRRTLIDALERAAQPLQRTGDHYRAITDAAKGKKYVLLGEATHGTAEFYRIRADITRRLIVEEGFAAVAVEADWPDAYRVNRYVCGTSGDTETDEALSNFKRFPVWMWRNTEVLAFVTWLRSYNQNTHQFADQIKPG